MDDKDKQIEGTPLKAIKKLSHLHFHREVLLNYNLIKLLRYQSNW